VNDPDRRRALIAFTAAALVCAAVPSAAQPRNISMIGNWEIVEATPGPWTDEGRRNSLTAEGKRMLKTVITFTSKEMKSSNRALTCKRGVLYETNEIVADALFQGNLPEPNPTAAAARLGFKGDVPSIDVRCLKALYTFHFRDADTAMFNLSNVIYTLKRQ